MHTALKIAIAAAAITTATGFVQEAEARRSSGGISRAASFSAPRAAISRPRVAAVKSFTPKATRISKPITAPGNLAGLKPGKIKVPPHILPPRVGHLPLPPRVAGPGIKLPPGFNPPGRILPLPPVATGPGLVPPPGLHLPPGFKPPPGLRPLPPFRPIDPPGNAGPKPAPTPPVAGGPGYTGPGIVIGGVVGLAGELIAADQVAVTIATDCMDLYAKWQATGSKTWKLAYYECTGDL